MATETALRLFLGEDHQFVFTILNATQTACVDLTGWTLMWMAKRYTSDADGAALVTKTMSSGIAIAGTFNASIALNAQVATVSVLDTDTLALVEALVHHELRRTDANYETVLSYGGLELMQGVQR
jgi:hypothetical protein